MAKFKKGGKRETPAISTASLPDIVFMLLFFFMVSTTMREVSLMVANAMPQATETVKLEKKSLVSNIYVGKPTPQYQGAYGTEPRIQLNDRFATLEELGAFVVSERESRKEEDRNSITNNLKVDKNVTMGVVTDIKNLVQAELPVYIVIAGILALIVLLITMESIVTPVLFLLCIGLAILYNMGTNIFLGQISYITPVSYTHLTLPTT